MNAEQEDIALANRPRDYAGLLWIFAASMLGFSMFCATSAIALSDPSLPTPIVIEARDIPNLAFSNLNTIAAQTAQAFAQLVATGTPTNTFTPSPTWTSSPTATMTASRTHVVPTRTETKESQPQQPTAIPPTSTPKPTTLPPTKTAVVIVTYTGTAISTEPPTETPVPEPSTDTPVPPPDTPVPPPSTDTPVPITTP
ncbi:MAG: hypothetical protein IPM31_11055 [Anaerolineae bacterium]|nr:hypothetical protein [Anaerolineae bacterium]MBL8104040.1 hypothetical protein [Anaerolineales bacterium]MCC7190805.1 hypothetical protein [Anaerolineales bacterium]